MNKSGKPRAERKTSFIRIHKGEHTSQLPKSNDYLNRIAKQAARDMKLIP